ncbi:MAG TPA: anti-sigma F factor [Candidatus Fimiplasma intestinipullorum]|uniref:Anti-sigma F factor n=1 Tax=Candidatus Fimiplasma intestinipullorum TaxID=2840825 RepID=A0A9D1HQ93_9FIRM|nr:anti-sigma F factor [Candidatus Fimiplasma intestinipullorum]
MEMHFDARIENEAFARTVAASFIAPLNPTMDELIEVKTIISEAVANAIIHGYNGQSEGQVYLRLETLDHELHIEVEDYGVGIQDINQACQPLYTTRQDLERSGMGMTIMDSLSDQMQIESIPEQGTKLVISKRFKHGSDSQA